MGHGSGPTTLSLGQRQKALEINLNPNIYGAFAEIGAGQEVARHFFRAGGAAGTIAKSISAYDMTMSDAIYGKETSGRYVCQHRLETMLDIEYKTLVDRLEDSRHPDTTFFVFADTVAAKSYKGTGENHGWIGIRFQHQPKSEPSEVILHVKMLDAENIQQQEALGLIGVNLIHAVYFARHDREQFILSLMDGLTSSRIEIDMIKAMGPALSEMDSRLLCLELVKNKLCEAVIFDSNGEVLQASDVLYKKNVLVVRGGYRPPTNLSLDMLESGLRLFKSTLPLEDKENIIVIPEISMSQLLDRGVVDNEDFLARVDLLGALGQKVLISNSDSYSDLNMFFSKYARKNIGFVVASYNLEQLLNPKKYENTKYGLLGSLGTLVEPKTKLFIYPSYDDNTKSVKNLDSITIAPELKYLMLFLTENKSIQSITDFNPEVVKIWSRTILKMIQAGNTDWENFVPASVALTVKTKCLFGAKCDV
jgi:hypothetical protein